MSNVEDIVKSELQKFEDQEQALQTLAAELQQSPKFAQFIEAQKNFKELESSVWKNIETVMIENDVMSIKNDKVTLSIANRVSFDIDMAKLPAKYIKQVPDTTLITGTFKLEGKPVRGTKPKYTKYLVKRIK